MSKSPTGPVVLELAPMPREQIGPFLLLGLDKTAEKATIDAHWAQRIKWARRNQLKAPLEDINWARDIVNDLDKRIRADASSLNADTTDGTLAALAQRYASREAQGEAGRLWQPLDSEKALADYVSAAEGPDVNALRDSLVVPPLPEELPAVALLLERLVQQPLDPWALDLPGGADPAPRAADVTPLAAEGSLA